MDTIIKECSIFFSEYIKEVKNYLTAAVLCKIAQLDTEVSDFIQITDNNKELLCYRNYISYTIAIEKYSNYKFSIELNINPGRKELISLILRIKSQTIYYSSASKNFLISNNRLNRTVKVPQDVQYVSKNSIKSISKDCESSSTNLFLLIFDYIEKYNELETLLEKLTKQRRVKHRKT